MTSLLELAQTSWRVLLGLLVGPALGLPLLGPLLPLAERQLDGAQLEELLLLARLVLQSPAALLLYGGGGRLTVVLFNGIRKKTHLGN